MGVVNIRKVQMNYQCENCAKICTREGMKTNRTLCSLECRLVGNIKKFNGCWIWQGKKNRDGYGEIMIDGKRQTVHRVSFVHFNNRPIEIGKCICHVCDVRLCINPMHLFEGSNRENTLDRTIKGRSAKGQQNAAAKHTIEDIKIIRKLYVDGLKLREISEQFKTPISTIKKIVYRMIWKHI